MNHANRLVQPAAAATVFRCGQDFLAKRCILAGLFMAVLAGGVAWGGPAPSAERFFLRDGDKVLFYGDSITEGDHYPLAIESFVRTRYPGMHIRWYNRGWGGDTASGGPGGTAEQRLTRDVIPLRPDVITIMLGMNDGYYYEAERKIYDLFSRALGSIVSQLEAALPHARLVLIESSPYDNVSDAVAPSWEADIPGGYNTVVARMGELTLETAEARGLASVRMNKPLVELVGRVAAQDAELGRQVIPDRIHPGEAGGWAVAAEILTAWHAPAVVSAVEFDAADNETVRTERARVIALTASAEGAVWDQHDVALPWWLSTRKPVERAVIEQAKLVDRFNQQLLKVTGLAPATYELLIDGESVATFTHQQLADGVNLALYDTPMKQQSYRVYRMIQMRHKIAAVVWRTLGVDMEAQADTNAPAFEAYRAMAALEEDLQFRIDDVGKPVLRHFEIRVASPSEDAG